KHLRLLDRLVGTRTGQAKIGVPLCLPFFHPPILLPLQSAIISEDYRSSYIRWAVVLLCVVGLCAMPLIDLAKLDLLDTALFLSFLPVFAGILQGQDTIFVLLGAFASFAFLLKSQDIAAGIALGLVTLRPHWAIALAIPLFFTRRKAF